MDPRRVPPVPPLPQSEITSSFHASDKDTSGAAQPDPFNSSLDSHSSVPRTTVRIDTSNLRPYASAGNRPTEPESLSPEKLEVSKTLSLQHINLMTILRSPYNHLYLFDLLNQIPEKGKQE